MSSGLLGLYNLGASALNAQQAGVAIAGKNSANVNTEGYQRESVDLQSEIGTNGVIAGASYRADDPILALRERQSSGAQGRAQTLSIALGTRVRVRARGESGTIEIQYYTPDQFDGIYQKLVGEE